MRGSKRLPVLIFGSLLVLSLVIMIIFWRRAPGYIAAAAACLWVYLLILPVLREEKRRKRKYHIFIPLAKHQPALPGSSEEAAHKDIATEKTEESPTPENVETPPREEGAYAAAESGPPIAPETPPATSSAELPVQEGGTPAGTARYIGHSESRKFHTPQCTTLPREKNRVYLSSREEAVAKGYTPCTYCKP